MEGKILGVAANGNCRYASPQAATAGSAAPPGGNFIVKGNRKAKASHSYAVFTGQRDCKTQIFTGSKELHHPK